MYLCYIRSWFYESYTLGLQIMKKNCENYVAIDSCHILLVCEATEK